MKFKNEKRKELTKRQRKKKESKVGITKQIVTVDRLSPSGELWETV